MDSIRLTVGERPMVACHGTCGPDHTARAGDPIEVECPGEPDGPKAGRHTYYCGCEGSGIVRLTLTTDPEPIDNPHEAPDTGWIVVGVLDAS